MLALSLRACHTLIKRETAPPKQFMDYHHAMLNLFESFERHQDELQSRNSLLALNAVQSPTFYVEAFFDGNLEWTEYAYDERELQNLKNDAIDSGCTFTVRLEDNKD